MSRLTEEMVIARSKQSDLATIKKLNCWGCNLSDITVIEKMAEVEVLGLSINEISSLEPFIHCSKLQELYLRNNLIASLKELAILQRLPALRNLWIAENPCVQKIGPNYRLAVLRILPNLTVLDNTQVTPEELEAAKRFESSRSVEEGEDKNEVKEPKEEHHVQPSQHRKLQHSPRQRNETQQNQSASPKPCNEQQQSQSVNHSPRQRIEQQEQQQQYQKPELPQQLQQQEYPQEEPQQQQYQHQQQQQHYQQEQKQQQNAQQHSPQHSSRQQRSRSTSSTHTEEHIPHPPSPKLTLYTKENRNSFQPEDRLPASNQDCPHDVGYRERVSIPPSISTQSMKEFYQSDRPAHPVQYRHSQMDLSKWEERQHHNLYGSQMALHRSATPARRSDMHERYVYRNGNARESWREREEPERMIYRRPDAGRFCESTSSASTDNTQILTANLLTATLCLLKELDCASLLVVENEVRHRIDQLSGE